LQAKKSVKGKEKKAKIDKTDTELGLTSAKHDALLMKYRALTGEDYAESEVNDDILALLS
jgi:isopentenyldiphosphate isomerase